MIERVVPKCQPPRSVPREFRRYTLAVLKAKWRDQVLFDHRLTASCRVLGYLLADRMTMDWTRDNYGETEQIVIWGAQDEMAKQTRMHVETVAAGIARLIRHGHLFKLARGNQITGSNRYQVIVKPTKPATSI